jgi:hypothetical protein
MAERKISKQQEEDPQIWIPEYSNASLIDHHFGLDKANTLFEKQAASASDSRTVQRLSTEQKALRREYQRESEEIAQKQAQFLESGEADQLLDWSGST